MRSSDCEIVSRLVKTESCRSHCSCHRWRRLFRIEVRIVSRSLGECNGWPGIAALPRKTMNPGFCNYKVVYRICFIIMPTSVLCRTADCRCGFCSVIAPAAPRRRSPLIRKHRSNSGVAEIGADDFNSFRSASSTAPAIACSVFSRIGAASSAMRALICGQAGPSARIGCH